MTEVPAAARPGAWGEEVGREQTLTAPGTGHLGAKILAHPQSPTRALIMGHTPAPIALEPSCNKQPSYSHFFFPGTLRCTLIITCFKSEGLGFTRGHPHSLTTTGSLHLPSFTDEKLWPETQEAPSLTVSPGVATSLSLLHQQPPAWLVH